MTNVTFVEVQVSLLENVIVLIMSKIVSEFVVESMLLITAVSVEVLANLNPTVIVMVIN